jgi:PadR family transcriptional regulator, regulatory protein PadR
MIAAERDRSVSGAEETLVPSDIAVNAHYGRISNGRDSYPSTTGLVRGDETELSCGCGHMLAASRARRPPPPTEGTAPMAELEPRNFLQPCLLLLLREQPDHGYELAARLRPMHDGEGDAGGVYRALRGMEKQGLVRSEWHTSDVGPAKRTYFVTPDGVSFLDELADSLCHTHQILHVFLDRYARVVAAAKRGSPEGNGHEPRIEHRIDDHRADSNGRCGGVRSARRSDWSAGH